MLKLMGKKLLTILCSKFLLSNSVTLFLNSFHASGDFCPRLITFANSLDPDQVGQNVAPGSGSRPFGTLVVFLKEV